MLDLKNLQNNFDEVAKKLQNKKDLLAISLTRVVFVKEYLVIRL